MQKLWDPIRCQFVVATPEEKVRQRWILAMTERLGYPKSLIAIEKSIQSLAKTKVFGDPSRRVDILCYTPAKEGLIPLLIVECKAGAQEAEPQVEGYNFSLEAPFLCVIQETKAKTFWKEDGIQKSVPFLPKYSELLKAI